MVIRELSYWIGEAKRHLEIASAFSRDDEASRAKRAEAIGATREALRRAGELAGERAA